MAFPIKKQQKPDLASEIHRIRGDVDAYIDSKVMELKQSQSGSGLPVQVLHQMIAKPGECPCRTGLRLLQEDSQ